MHGRYDGRDTAYGGRGQGRRAGGSTCMSLCALNTVLRYLRLYLASYSLSSIQFRILRPSEVPGFRMSMVISPPARVFRQWILAGEFTES